MFTSVFILIYIQIIYSADQFIFYLSFFFEDITSVLEQKCHVYLQYILIIARLGICFFHNNQSSSNEPRAF